MIGAFRSASVPLFLRVAVPSAVRCFSVVAFFDGGLPCFRNFNSTISVDTIRMLSFVDIKYSDFVSSFS